MRRWASLVVPFLLGCAGAPSRDGSHLAHRGKPPAPEPSGDPGLRAARVVELGGVVYGPHLGDRPEGSIVVWAERAGSGASSWKTLSLDPQGAAYAAPMRVADAPAEVGLVALRPLASSGPRPGFVLMYSWREFSGAQVGVLALGTAGELRSAPTVLADALPDVVWVEALPTAAGALLAWAVRHDDRAAIYVAPITGDGVVEAEPRLVVDDARAWQLAATAEGAALAVVARGNAEGSSGGKAPEGSKSAGARPGAGKAEVGSGGKVRVTLLDAGGAPLGASRELTPGASAEADVDLARIGERLVVVWSERGPLEASVHGASLGLGGDVLRPAGPLLPSFGDQFVVRLVPPVAADAPAFLVWERMVERPRQGRLLRLATLSADAAVGSTAAVLVQGTEDGTSPEFAGTARGVAALTLAPACDRGGVCDGAPLVPTYVHLDRALDVVASEPLRLDALSGAAADLAWGLSCRRFECLSLAARRSDPAPIFAVRLEPRGSHAQPAARRVEAEPPPRIESLRVLGRLDAVADLAAAPLGGGVLGAWVSDFEPGPSPAPPTARAPDGRSAPLRARLEVRALVPRAAPAAAAPNGGLAAPELALGEATVVSLRAESLAGVSVAPGDAHPSRALIAWGAPDAGGEQVFLTLVDATGKKLSQRMLTHGEHHARWVTALGVGDGWLVAWSEESGAQSSLRLARVDAQLVRRGPEQTLTPPGSAAGESAMLALGDRVLVAYEDRRGGDTLGALYGRWVSAATAAPLGEERRLTPSGVHARSALLAKRGESLVLGWIATSGDSVAAAVARAGASASAPNLAATAPAAPSTRSATSSTAAPSSATPSSATWSSAASSLRCVTLSAALEPLGSPVVLTPPQGGRIDGASLECDAGGCLVVFAVAGPEQVELFGARLEPGGEVTSRRLIRLDAAVQGTLAPVMAGGHVVYVDRGREAEALVREAALTWR